MPESQNVTFRVQETKLVIEVDLSRELGQSASDKSIIIATTAGNVPVPGREEVKVGLNSCYCITWLKVPASRRENSYTNWRTSSIMKGRSFC
jgi:hypothetical protein